MAMGKRQRHPHDPDAKIAKMKDGRTHLAQKHEHAVDLDSGAVVAVTVTVQAADEGDTTTWRETTEKACENLNALKDDPVTCQHVHDEVVEELVADKGYHSTATMVDNEAVGIRSYVSEPDRGQRNWKDKSTQCDPVYANRRRIRGKRGRRLLPQRGERVKRGFAHELDTGGMRRTHPRGHQNILKRLLVHVGGFNLGLVMRKLVGVGTPRVLQGVGRTFFALLLARDHAVALLYDLLSPPRPRSPAARRDRAT